MEINKQRLIKETSLLGNNLYDGLSFDRIGREWSSFLAMNSIIANLTGYCLNHELVFEDKPNTKEYIRLDTARSLRNFYERVLSERELFKQIFTNYAITYNDSELETYLIGSDMRRYPDKDAKDIIYSFFSQFGDKAYQSVKKMFDEERIQMGYQYTNSPAYAFYTGSVLLQNGFVCMYPETFDTSTMSYFAHEMGHAIDKEIFYHPQQKKIKVYDDPYNEIPSSFFDWCMLDFLIENKIDEKGALTLKSYHMNQMFFRTLYLAKMLNQPDLQIEEELSEDFRRLFLYGTGYYTSLAMSDLAKQDPQEYFKLYTNLICSRKECDFLSLIENGGINSDAFVSGDILQKKLDEQTLALKRMYKIKE